MQLRLALLLCASFVLPLAAAEEIQDGQFVVTSNLKAGVVKIDITPPDAAAIKIVGHVRQASGVRDPLRAGVLILDDGETKAAIVTLDTIGAWEDMMRDVRAKIEAETGVPAANILVAALHNHFGPGYVENMRWAADLIKKLGTAAKQAVGGYEPNRSILKPEAEAVILKELGALADRVVDDVFESFSKDMQKRETEEKARLQSASTDKP